MQKRCQCFRIYFCKTFLNQSVSSEIIFMEFTLLIVIIVLSLIFDYINGFHDAANAIATVVATKVLSPFQAVLWAAFFNFLAYWVFGFGVADSVAKTADSSHINLIVILAGVIASIMWNLITW